MNNTDGSLNADYILALYSGKKDELKERCRAAGLAVSGSAGVLANRLAAFLGGEQNVAVASRKSALPELRGEVKLLKFRCSACGKQFKAAEKPRACPLCGYVPGELNVRHTDSATIGIPNLKNVPVAVADLVTEIANHGGEVIHVDDKHIEFKGVTVKVHHPKKVWPARHSLQWPKWMGLELDVVAG